MSLSTIKKKEYGEAELEDIGSEGWVGNVACPIKTQLFFAGRESR